MARFRKTGPAAALFLALCLARAAGESVGLNLRLQAIEQPSPPEVFDDAIIFSYRPPAKVFIVGARFSHEHYGVFHTFRKNENGVYVLALPLPGETEVIKYRLMVDGVWIADPANPAAETDPQGVVFSLLPYEATARTPVESPRLLPDGYVEFSVEGTSGELITIAGDFNGFDPFTHRLAETRPGVYSIRIKLLPGRHLYYFVLDGVSFVDSLNPESVLDAERRRLSVVTVK